MGNISLVKCKNCKFWRTENIKDEFGECRRFPPQVIASGDTEWPVTVKDDFCGVGEKL